MKNVIKIAVVLLCAALALGSCRKKQHTPEVNTQIVPLEFSAVSQTMVKAATETFPYNDFGVWGIARQTGVTQPYILWNSDSMVSVSKGADGQYIPSSAAYWLVGYTYNFIAVAPYEMAQTTTLVNTGSSSGDEQLTFTCDVSEKGPQFDLLAAVAQNTIASRPTTPQELTFWHLFTKLNVNVVFGDGYTGTVSKIILKKVDATATYTLSFEDEELSVDCVSGGDASKEITVNGEVYLIPQDFSKFELYLDFVIEKDGKTISAKDYMVTLSGLNLSSAYNESYNLKLTIVPKTIDFDVDITVTPWEDADIKDLENNLEVPIK